MNYKGDLDVLFNHELLKYAPFLEKINEFEKTNVKLTSKIYKVWEDLMTTSFKKTENDKKSSLGGLDQLKQSEQIYTELRQDVEDGTTFYRDILAEAQKLQSAFQHTSYPPTSSPFQLPQFNQQLSNMSIQSEQEHLFKLLNQKPLPAHPQSPQSYSPNGPPLPPKK